MNAPKASPLMSVETALERVLDGAHPLDAETVDVTEALGRVLARADGAHRDQPPFAASAMDGYAVRAAEAVAGARLRVAGEAAAGSRHAGPLGPGEAVRIFTGAPVPEGADAIVIQEDTRREGAEVEILEAARPGRHVRARGLDFKAGDTPFPIGRLLAPRDLGLLAAMGHARISVFRKPRVAVLATGDELVPVGHEPGIDQIIASSIHAILALATVEGARAVDLGIAGDRPEALAAAIARAQAADADVLVTLGGASVGDHDLVHAALTRAGARLDVNKIAMRPGKPMMSGRLGAMRVVGLPGNPVSSHVCALLFLRPLIRRLAGRLDARIEPQDAVLGCPLRANDHRRDHLRARLTRENGVTVATAWDVQDSSMLRPLAMADALIIREPHAPAAQAGEPCRILPLDSHC